MKRAFRRIGTFLPLLLALQAVASCGSAKRAAAAASPSSATSGETASRTGVLVGAGDIGVCGTKGSELTARLLDRIPGTVFTAGDNAYFQGTADQFTKCYDPTWGRHRARTRPAPGNHDYESGGGAYYNYFGANAGPAGLGYYAFTVGLWRVISLNSEVSSAPGSAQLEWLHNELSTARTFCTAVIWHRPLFSSGRAGDNADMRDVWRTLYEFDVDLVINGHDHDYERFAPQDPDGRLDPARGIREFVVGTGGAVPVGFTSLHANSEVRGAALGVITFTLNNGGYQWAFVPVPSSDGSSFVDSGSDSCH